jgi:hypothetical protein
MRKVILALLIVSFVRLGVCQDRPSGLEIKATVIVRAVDGFGNRLSDTAIDSFVDHNGLDRVALFHGGAKADAVPLGNYRVTVRADVSFRKSTFDVEIAAPSVTITAGLEWYGIENARITGRLRGRLAGFPSSLGQWWCKASGLYLKAQYEAAATRDSSNFDFGEVPPGLYTLACVADGKFVVLRTVRVAADVMPLTVDYRPGEESGLR